MFFTKRKKKSVEINGITIPSTPIVFRLVGVDDEQRDDIIQSIYSRLQEENAIRSTQNLFFVKSWEATEEEKEFDGYDLLELLRNKECKNSLICLTKSYGAELELLREIVTLAIQYNNYVISLEQAYAKEYYDLSFDYLNEVININYLACDLNGNPL